MNPEEASRAAVGLALEVPIRWGELLPWLRWREAPLASVSQLDEKNVSGNSVRACQDASIPGIALECCVGESSSPVFRHFVGPGPIDAGSRDTIAVAEPGLGSRMLGREPTKAALAKLAYGEKCCASWSPVYDKKVWKNPFHCI